MRRFFCNIVAGLIFLASFMAPNGHTASGKPKFVTCTVAVLGAAAPTKRKRGGGNLLVFKQVKLNSDGTYGALTGSDNLGDTAGSWHVLGTHEDTGIQRDDKIGQWAIECTVLEMDKDHRNLMMMVSPITSQSVVRDPDFTAEDGTQVVNSETTGNTTFPYFEVWYLDAPIGGKAQAFAGIMQFAPVYSQSNKITEWSKNKFKLMSVDANGYTCPALPTAAAFSTFTAPTFAAPYQHGKHLEGT